MERDRYALSLDRAELAYRGELGWQVRRGESELHLVVGQGIAGVQFAVREAVAVMERLAEWHALGPVIALPGEAEQWVFLVDADDTALSAGVALGPRFLFAGRLVMLPPTITDHGPVRWVLAPNRARRTLPPCGAVLAAHRPEPRSRRQPSCRRRLPHDRGLVLPERTGS